MSVTLLLAQLNLVPGDLAGNAQQLIHIYRKAQKSGTINMVVTPELSLMGYPIRDVITRHPFLVDENIGWLETLAQQTNHVHLLVGFVEKTGISTGKPFYNTMAILANGRIQGLVRKCLLPVYGEFNDTRTFEPSPVTGCLGAETLNQLGALYATQVIKTEGHPYELHMPNGESLPIALSICEDLWSDPTFFSSPNHNNNPIVSLMAHQPKLLINCSASPSRSRKAALRQALLSHVAQRWHVPLVYVNQVGAVDECSFDGLSSVLNHNGQLLVQADAFVAGSWPITLSFNNDPSADYDVATSTALSVGLAVVNSVAAPPKRFEPDDSDELKRVYLTLCQGIRDYFYKTGFQKALLGLSGGLDSAVCATLLVDALGNENVLGVSMPSQLTPLSSRRDARALATNLNMQWLEISIEPFIAPLMTALDNIVIPRINGLSDSPEAEKEATRTSQDRKRTSRLCAPKETTEATHSNNDDGDNAINYGNDDYTSAVSTGDFTWDKTTGPCFATDNAQAMSRATMLRLLGNQYRALPIATSDKSELYMGYTTVNGDMSGALAPLADVPKTQVRALARWLNNNRAQPNVLPQSVIDKPSGADLAIDPATGKLLTAEAALMPYLFADEVIWRIEALKQSHAQLLNETFVYETRYDLPLAQKRAWLDKFFARMSAAVFKWWLSPPTILVSGNGSIAKTDYHHPITSGRIVWQGHTPTQRQDLINQSIDTL
jgi:NAD+ synthetase